MSRYWISTAIAAAVMLIGDPALGDKKRDDGPLFPDGLVAPLDDCALAGAVGMGPGDSALPAGAGPDGSRTAVILWDETRPPVTPPPGTGTVQQAGGRVVVTTSKAAGAGY